MKKVLFVSFLVLINLTSTANSAENFSDCFFQKDIVNDFANILEPAQVSMLNFEISEITKKTNVEYAVCIINELNNHPIKTIATLIRKKWKIGIAQDDKGVLMLISRNDREVYVTIGNGLVKEISNDQLQYIVDNTIIPKLSKNNYYLGILKGIKTISQHIDSSKNKGSIFHNILLYILFFTPFALLSNRFGNTETDDINDTYHDFTSSGGGGGGDGGGAGGSF